MQSNTHALVTSQTETWNYQEPLKASRHNDCYLSCETLILSLSMLCCQYEVFSLQAYGSSLSLWQEVILVHLLQHTDASISPTCIYYNCSSRWQYIMHSTSSISLILMLNFSSQLWERAILSGTIYCRTWKQNKQGLCNVFPCEMIDVYKKSQVPSNMPPGSSNNPGQFTSWMVSNFRALIDFATRVLK